MSTTNGNKSTQKDWPRIHFRLPPDLHADWEKKLASVGQKKTTNLTRLIKQWVRETR
jgi:hypothetical protein